jgi:hypothetical protein
LVCNVFWCFSLWQTIPVHRDGQPIQPTRSTTLSKAQTLKDAIPLSWLVLSGQRWWDFPTRLERTMFSSTQLTRQQRLHDKGV